MLKFTLAALCLVAFAGVAQAQSSASKMPAMPGTAGAAAVGNLTLRGGFTRATLPNAPVAGGFLTITNTGSVDDVLLSATSDFAGMTQVHEMTMQGDVMQMRALAEGLPVPAGETVTLAPGGYHIMFMDLKQPLVEGETVTVTLTFRDAGPVDLILPVGAPNARAGHQMHAMPTVSQ